jgi:hypothetical protein
MIFTRSDFVSVLRASHGRRPAVGFIDWLDRTQISCVPCGSTGSRQMRGDGD